MYAVNAPFSKILLQDIPPALMAGSLFVLLACICWGIENNCTRKLSSKDPMQIVLLKGIFSGLGSLIIGFVIGEGITALWIVPGVLLLGFTAYGLSIYLYVYAQRILGAARTSAYYAVAPFIGAALSLWILHEMPGNTFFAALLLMIAGAWLSSVDKPPGWFCPKRRERSEKKERTGVLPGNPETAYKDNNP